MWGYLSRRLAGSFAILIGITIVTFGLTFLIPADPVRMIAGRNATAQTVENIRQQLGLDRSVPEQYARYVMRLAQGDLGRSYVQKTQVSDLVLSRLPATLLLMAGAIFFELLIGIPAGIFAATRRGRPADRWIMMLSFAGVSAPQFVVGLLLLYIFSNLLSLFPMGGYGTLGHLILPALTLGIAGGGWYARMMRSSMVDVLRQDYVRTARAKGLGPAKVVLVHAFRNAVLPIIAMIGLDVGIFMSGAVVVESVYGWPGIGQLAWMGIQRIDIPIIMGVTLVAAVGIVIGNLVADLITPLIDPRIRLR
ncbi:glutathione ABC transporter permease [Hypericibacter terrae]|jgi:peptide/nickel transport system permease protein|uniref:Glutathione ABC transporter permease n=1 Tax=Hypericibacter terrae TaxID=2602015 RepID=A0A5J6MQ62_9PROT|nr:ABC transporter permease [Hypericibacter terrae]QEX19658.1 glutathione ABC transporter permease [Hypericibacter terrae]